MNCNDYLPIHPRTGLRAVGIVKGRPVWPILGGSEPGDGGQGGGGDGGTGTPPGDGGAAFKAPQSQEELDRIINKAVGRAHAKYADYEDLKAKAEKHDALELELSSEADKKAHEARQAARQEADAEYRPKLAETAFRIAIGDQKPADEVNDFIADLNLARFLTDKGDVDTAKVLARVKQFTGASKAETPPPPGRIGPSSSGQGNRTPPNSGKGEAARNWLSKQGITVD